MRTEVYDIEGMSCAVCSSAVERVTRKLEGVESSDVNLTTNKMTITYDETKVTHESAAVVVTLVMLGKYMESRSRDKTSEAIRKLMELAPDTAILYEDGAEREVETASVRVGQHVLIKPYRCDEMVCNGCVSRINKGLDREGIAHKVGLEKKTVVIEDEKNCGKAVEVLEDLGFSVVEQ